MFRLTVRPGLVLEIVNPLRIEEEFALVEKNREHLAPFLSWVDLTHSVDDLLNYAQRMREEYASGRAAACLKIAWRAQSACMRAVMRTRDAAKLATGWGRNTPDAAS